MQPELQLAGSGRHFPDLWIDVRQRPGRRAGGAPAQGRRKVKVARARAERFSGLGLDESAARRCKVFGQINVSVDGVGAAYEQARGFDGFRHAERALRLLRAVKKEVGINCVVSRSSFEHVPEVARLTRKLRLN